MNLKKILICGMMGLAVHATWAQEPIPTCPMTHFLSLNGVWQFKYVDGTDIGRDTLFSSPAYDASDWQGIRVPGNWQTQGFEAPVYDGKLTPGYGLYRQAFRLDNSFNTSLVYIAFDGVENGFTFYINSKKVGTFNSAFNRCMFDISKYVNYGGPNMIAVKVPKTESPGYQFDTNDDWSLTGISRSVTIYAIPVTHFEDVTIRTSLTDTLARIDLGFRKFAIKKNVTVTIDGQLVDAEENIVASFRDVKGDSCSLLIPDYHPWTAETPYLYTLQLQLKENGRPVERHYEKVGLREVTWDHATLRVNGTPVKLRGVNHHDLSPYTGRAISDDEILADLTMMRKANINMIRTSHYPPKQRLIELCDSMGFYVICEVPFGYGDNLLNKPQMLDILKERAYYTVKRDKNHPSVIIWSVGNENPVTENGLATGRYVHQLDPTRPYLFPSTHRPFNQLLEGKYDFIPLYSCHYPLLSELKTWPKRLDKALVNTEYAHALGTDLGQMQDIVDEWYKHPQLAGGAVWEFADQGLQRVSAENVDRDKPTDYAWASRSIYFDTESILGTDGITYADRTPKTNYYQVRKVYSPVKVTTEQKGNDIILTLENRYDFTDLSQVKAELALFADGQKVNTTPLPLQCKPRHTVSFNIATPKELPSAAFHYYVLTLKDKQGETFYEKSIRIGNDESLATDPMTPAISTFFTLSSPSKKMKASDVETYIKNTLMARVGKKPTMCQNATLSGNQGKKHQLWKNHLMPCTKVMVEKAGKNRFLAHVIFDAGSTEFVDGTIEIDCSNGDALHIRYDLMAHGDGEAVETGLAVKTQERTGNIRWVGKGPYACYPGKDALSEFGVWSMNSNDLYFPGNREEVECLLFTDILAKGFAIVPGSSKDVAVELYPDGIVVSHNSHVASPFNKNIWPTGTVKLDGYNIKGAFSIYPQDANWSESLRKLFGEPTKAIKPFNPFYHSYDQ